MKERPILFSAPMVRALLAGTKMQTRRVMEFSDDLPAGATPGSPFISADKKTAVTFVWPVDKFTSGATMRECRYGQPGDRLWVRETFWAYGRWETRYSAKKGRDEWHFVDMTAECGLTYGFAEELRFAEMRKRAPKGSVAPCWWKRPAIFMPRGASRILRNITGVRVERLHDINEPDALAEGYPRDWMPGGDGPWCSPVQWYADLWKDINGESSWDTNPWVWVVQFRRVQP